MAKNPVKWLKEVDKHDFAAGESYLRLVYPAKRAQSLVSALRRVELTTFAARDILRASELTVLPPKDAEVAKQLKKLAKGEKLSPLPLVREAGHARLVVADGFHRLCAVMHVNADERIPCKIA